MASGAHPRSSKNFVEIPKIDDFWHYDQSVPKVEKQITDKPKIIRRINIYVRFYVRRKDTGMAIMLSK